MTEATLAEMHADRLLSRAVLLPLRAKLWLTAAQAPRLTIVRSMHEEGERRHDLRERKFARFADLIELRSHARQDFSRPSDTGAEFVDIGFACPLDLGRVRQLVPARTGQRAKVALDANLQAPAACLDLAARAIDGPFAGS